MVLTLLGFWAVTRGQWPESASPNPAANEVYVIVRPEMANVRGGPGTEFEIVGKIARGRILAVLEKQGDWTRIRPRQPSKFLHGWIASRLIEEAQQPTPTRPEVARREEFVDRPTANVRAGPGKQHSVVGQVTELNIVEILEDRDGWERIRVPGLSIEGWIYGDLTSTTPAAGRELFARQMERIFLDNFEDVRVRATGTAKRTLRVGRPYVSRVTAHHFEKEAPWKELRDAGFRKVILEDEGGYFSWDL